MMTQYILVIIIVAAAVYIALRRVWKGRRENGCDSSCHGGCSGCQLHDYCKKNSKGAKNVQT